MGCLFANNRQRVTTNSLSPGRGLLGEGITSTISFNRPNGHNRLNRHNFIRGCLRPDEPLRTVSETRRQRAPRPDQAQR
jgi:hypothetical protein